MTGLMKGELLDLLLLAAVLSGAAAISAACQSPRGGPLASARAAASPGGGDGGRQRQPQKAADETSPVRLSPLALPLKQPRVVVAKGQRRLVLYDGDEAVRTYRVGLGFSPVGDKVRQGDGATPEGSFYVCMKNDRSKFYLSLGLSYPNEEDAERGLRDKLITRAQHGQIVRALKEKRTPPWNTPLGGEIFIHGNGSQTDWTWGCVALEDGDMKELFEAVPVGAPVVIEP